MQRQGDDLEAYKEALAEEKQANKQVKKTSAFAGFAVASSSESEEEKNAEEVNKVEPKQAEISKKKKRNRGKKNKNKPEPDSQAIDLNDKKLQDLDAFLDEVVKQTKEETKKHKQTTFSYGESILSMEKQYFNHKRELKMLFAKAMSAQG